MEFRILGPLEVLEDGCQIEEDGSSRAAGRAHADYYLELAEQQAEAVEKAEQTALDTYEREFDNLRVAFTWLVAEDPQAALQLASALSSHWYTSGQLAEGRTGSRPCSHNHMRRPVDSRWSPRSSPGCSARSVTWRRLPGGWTVPSSSPTRSSYRTFSPMRSTRSTSCSTTPDAPTRP